MVLQDEVYITCLLCTEFCYWSVFCYG